VKAIKIFDTTLRDGEQAPSCSMNINEKVEIALALERLRVDVIEAGFSVISDGDFQSVKKVSAAVKNCTVASLCRCLSGDIDAGYNSLKNAVSPRLHLFIATSPVHMKFKLKMTEDEVLNGIKESISYAKKFLSDIEFSAEDAMRSDPVFLKKAIETAIKAGATTVNIPDTVGYASAFEMKERIEYLKANVKGIEKAVISVHCHNDLGQAAANSLAAVLGGATQIECTVNGIGERAGNAALEEVVMAIATRSALYGRTNVDTREIYKASRLVYNIIGMNAPINKPIIGGNAFSHEAGIHQHGMLCNKNTYEIMTPESVGLQAGGGIVLGKHSGRKAVEESIGKLGYKLSKAELDTVFKDFKSLSDKKKIISEHDLDALVSHKENEIETGYRLTSFIINSGNRITGSAVVVLNDGKSDTEEVAIGDGPVDAAYKAVDKIMNVKQRELIDYTIRSISGGGDALGEAVVKVRCGDKTVTGRGLSTDVIEASIIAYINALNKTI